MEQMRVSEQASSARRAVRPVNLGRTATTVALHLGLLAAILAGIIPFLLMVRVSLAGETSYLAGLDVWLAPLTLEHYQAVLAGSGVGQWLLNSLVISLATTVLVVTIGAMAGFAFAKMRSEARDNVMFFVLSTRMGPAVVFALPLYLLAVQLKLIDTHLGLALVYTFANLAFAVWLLYGFFCDVPGEVEEAGLLDGLSPLGVFRHLSLPLVAPGLIATAIFVFIFTWNEFFYALVLTRAEARTFPTMVPSFFGAFRVEWGMMFAASTLGVLPPVIFGLLIRRSLIRGLTMGEVR